jgi:exosortase family protein XrtM
MRKSANNAKNSHQKAQPVTSPPNLSNIDQVKSTNIRQSLLLIILFLGLFFLLQILYGLANGTWLQRMLIEELTVKTAASLINWISPTVGVVAMKTHLNAIGGGVNVANGCNGLEVMFIYIAAIAIAPLNVYSKITGLLIGIPYIFILNQLRLVALFFTYRMNKSFFSSLHSTIAPILLITLTMLFFAYWLSRHQKAVDPIQSKDVIE